MILSVKIDKENISMKVKDDYMAFFNSLRRSLLMGVDAHMMTIKNITKLPHYIKIEYLNKLFDRIYINQYKIKDIESFSIDVKSDKEYKKIYSNDISFFDKNYKIVKSPIRNDLYLFTIKPNDHIKFYGVLENRKQKCAGNIVFKYDGDSFNGEGIFGFNILEIYNLRDVMKMSLKTHILDKLLMFQKEDETINITKDYDSTILNLIVEDLNYNNEKMFAGFIREHILLDKYTLRLNSSENVDTKKELELCIQRLINKCNKFMKEIDTKCDKYFIDNY